MSGVDANVTYDGDTNVGKAVEAFLAAGFVTVPVVIDPKPLVGVSSRPRIFFPTLHIERYCERIGFAAPFKDQCDHVCRLVSAWVAKIKALMAAEHPRLDLEQFLLPSEHYQVLEMEDALAAKLELAKRRKASGVEWVKKHKVAYIGSGLEWGSVAARADASRWADSVWFRSLPEREQCILMYWDDARPLPDTTGSEEELTTYLCAITHPS